MATALTVGGMLAVGTFIIAAALFEQVMIGIGAVALFLLVILIEIPYLGLLVTESERDEREKISRPSGDTAQSEPRS